MTIKFGITAANAALDALETAIGTAPLLRVYDLTAGAPADCASAITGTLLAECTLPSDWMAAASGGSKAKSGTWQDTSANNSGTADFFRIYDSSGTTCHEQGTVTATGGGGDMTVDSTSFTAGQSFTVNTYTWSFPV